MIDKTTLGFIAEPEEVEAVLNSLCGYHLAERDPVFRYTVLTREQVLYAALVATIKRERGRALAELSASGHTLTEVATLTGLGSRQRVHRLIAVAKAAEEAAAEVQAASRDFDERLAAVEATLDEVNSGIMTITEDASEAFDPVIDHPTDDIGPDVAAVDEPAPGATAALAPTQIMPALSSVLHPTKEMPETEETPWWRRGRDTGAA